MKNRSVKFVILAIMTLFMNLACQSEKTKWVPAPAGKPAGANQNGGQVQPLPAEALGKWRLLEIASEDRKLGIEISGLSGRIVLRLSSNQLVRTVIESDGSLWSMETCEFSFADKMLKMNNGTRVYEGKDSYPPMHISRMRKEPLDSLYDRKFLKADSVNLELAVINPKGETIAVEIYQKVN